MKFRVPQEFIYDFAEKILREVIEEDISEHDLENIVYEAGERNWEEDNDHNYFYIDRDYEDEE